MNNDQGKKGSPIIVGVVASPGRLEAFQEFLAALGDAPGFPVIFVQQVGESSGSPLGQTLRAVTTLPVIQIAAPEKLKPNCVYVVPARQIVEIKDGVVRFVVAGTAEGRATGVDHLFHSLALDQGRYAVGIVMSGDEKSWAGGLKAISDSGGLTFAQDCESESLISMSNSASRACVAGHRWSPGELAVEVMRYAACVDTASTGYQNANDIITQMERELITSRTDLERTLQDMEAANEELKSSNEELLAMNEELQAAIEELKASKEEVQVVLARIAQSEADQRNLLDSTQIATLFLDSDLQIRSFTPGVTALYNLIPTDVGRPLQDVAHTSVAMPPFPKELSRVENWPVEDEVQTRAGRCYMRRIQPYVNSQKERGDGLVVTFYEITEQKKLRMRLAAAHAVTKLLADADTFETAIPKVLNALRVSLSAEVCLLWRIDDRGEFLSCVETDAIDDSRQPFVDQSRKIQLAVGEGLPGRVWKDREPIWFGDVQNQDGFVRAAAAAESQLSSGVATPIIVGHKFKGVIEIFTTRKLAQEPELLQLLGAVGNEIGQFIRQRRLTDTARDEEVRKSAILQSALDCIITMDTAGRIVDFNPAAERTFGYAASQVVGQELADTIIPEGYREAHRRGLARFLSSSKSNMLGQRIELEAQRADGSVLPVELAISVSLGRDGSPFFTGYLRDITERKRAEAILLQRAELAALHASLAVSLAGEAALNEILETCCQRIADGLNASVVRVWLLNEPDQVLELIASAGISTQLDGAHRRVALGELEIGRIAATRQPLLTNDVSRDPFVADPQWAVQDGMVAFAGYPLIVEHRVVGVVALFAKHLLAPEVFEQLLPMADAMAQCIARKESEQRLLDREQRLHLALDAGRLGTWQWDIGADRVTWSDQLYEIFGYSKNQFQSSSAGFLNIIHADDRRRVSERLKAIFEGTCEAFELDFRVVRGDDQKIIWTSGRGVIHRDEHNNPMSITAVANDITDRKHWELELTDRESHLRSVIDNTLFFIGVLAVDGTLLEANAAAMDSAALDRSQVIGKKFWDCYWWNFNQESVSNLQVAVRRAAEGEVVRYDVAVRMAGDVRIIIDFMLCPVRSSDGSITHLIPSGVDISERVKIEREQRSITRRMEMALRAGGMAAWEWTRTKSIWTRELYELLGLDSDQEASPELFFSLVHSDDLDSLKNSWERATAGSDTYDSEFRIVRPDGQVRWLKGLGEVVRDKSGKVVGMYGVHRDSTKDHLQAESLRESERRAHEASASKSAFLANMSHEIRTPMTAILGYSELLRELVDNDEAKQHLQTIRRNGDYLLAIINDILDLSKIEAGKLDVESERFEPYRLIDDVRSIMELRAEEGGLRLEIEYTGKLPKVIQSDAKRLKQILINLVGNAIKFTRKGRVQIRVSYSAQTRQLQFDVIDTGIGISAEQMERLFKPFSQGDASVSRNFGGTGLGLAISQRLAKLLGGTITASSTEGVGSTFSVSIATGEIAATNLVDYRSLAAGIRTEALTGNSETNNLSCHVLIVDDRRDIRFLSKRILTKWGATVDECEDGLIAVDHIAACLDNASCPDLILLDMQMPNLDGYATARRLRSLGYSGPIVALTADAMQGDMSQCIEAGCNDYLSKPIDSGRLIELVRSLIT